MNPNIKRPRRKVVWALVGRNPAVFSLTLLAWGFGGCVVYVEPVVLQRELSDRDTGAGFYLGRELVVHRVDAEAIPPGEMQWVPGLVDEEED